MSDSLTGYFYQHRILLTPLQVIMGRPRRRSEKNSTTGKTKVRGKARLVATFVLVCNVRFEKHMPRLAKFYP